MNTHVLLKRITIDDLFKAEKLVDEIPKAGMKPPLDYGKLYDTLKDPEYVRKCKLLLSGVNYETNKKIDKTGKTYKKASIRLKEDYGFNENNYVELSNETRDEFIKQKENGYRYISEKLNRENLEYTRKAKETNDAIMKRNNINREKATKEMTERNAEIDALNEKMMEENSIIVEMNSKLRNDCSLKITYKDVEYSIPCKYNCSKTPGCSSKHECRFEEIMETHECNCGACRIWLGCGEPWKYFRVTRCSICGMNKL